MQRSAALACPLRKTAFMKKIAQIVVLFFLTGSVFAQFPSNTVNPIIGDESFIAIFGIQPGQDTDDQLRIQTHLFYVENKLRARPADGLSEQQRENREKVLDLLQEYWKNGVFPANLDYLAERRPCFIDNNGNICAVGYLVEKTAGLAVAEQINEEHQYDYLLDMNSPVIEAWAKEHGLTLEECAMIQPSYQPLPPVGPDGTIHQPIKSGYGISSGLVGGFNLAINTINISGKYGNIKTISYIGLVSGFSQIMLGIANVRKDKTTYPVMENPRTTSYKGQRNLSYLNIAVGTTTMVTSTINLLLNKKLNSKNNSVGLYSYPGLNNEMNIGLTMSTRL
jgi:hypothetical protein